MDLQFLFTVVANMTDGDYNTRARRSRVGRVPKFVLAIAGSNPSQYLM